MAEGKNNKLNIKPFYNFSFNEMMKNYIKEFNTFEEGYTEMISILPSIKVYGGEVANYDIVVKKMMELIGENIPSPTNPNYPNTLAFTIKQNEVSFKTDDRIAFGWRILFDKESGNYKYQMRITFFAVSMSTRKYADALEEITDTEVDSVIKDEILALVQKTDGVLGCHDFRSRVSGARMFIELHLEMDGNATLFTAHEISDKVEQLITDRFPQAQVIIHQDPHGIEEYRLDQQINGHYDEHSF